LQQCSLPSAGMSAQTQLHPWVRAGEGARRSKTGCRQEVGLARQSAWTLGLGKVSIIRMCTRRGGSLAEQCIWLVLSSLLYPFSEMTVLEGEVKMGFPSSFGESGDSLRQSKVVRVTEAQFRMTLLL
jgi:hypothetical protein